MSSIWTFMSFLLDKLQRDRILLVSLIFVALLVSAGLDIYNFVNVYTRLHTFIFVVLSIVISVWLVSSYYHHWNKEKDGQFRRFIFGSIPMFIGAQLAILGTITYPRCPTSPLPRDFHPICIVGINPTLNYVGAGLFVLGFVFWYLNRNERPSPVFVNQVEEGQKQRSEIALPASGGSIAEMPHLSAPPPSPSPSSSSVSFSPPLQQQKQQQLPYPLLLGLLAGFLISVFDWWVVLTPDVSLAFGDINALAIVLFLPAIAFPVSVAVFAMIRYHNTRGMFRLLAGEFIVFTVSLVIFIILFLLAVVLAAAANGGQEILTLQNLLFALSW
jgi:hypothetical protein